MTKGKPQDKENLACWSCPYGKTAVCTHPSFKERKLKPLILVEEGIVYPIFCPLKKEERRCLSRQCNPSSS